VSVVVNEGLQLLLPLAGLFDVDKELARLTKQKAKVNLRLRPCSGQSKPAEVLIVAGVSGLQGENKTCPDDAMRCLGGVYLLAESVDCARRYEAQPFRCSCAASQVRHASIHHPF
jgi:hypothetical protein